MEKTEENRYSVYAHINKSNKKMYVGLTSQKLQKRWNKGEGYKKCTYFYRAIQKYGWDGFEHIIITSGLTKDEAENIEKFLIKELDLMNPDRGYNLQSGGFNGEASEITRERIKEAAIKRSQNEEWRKKQSDAHIGLQAGEKNPMYGKNMSEETRKKLYEANLGKHPSEETRKKMKKAHSGEANPMFGKHHSEETKNKIREKNSNEDNPNAKKVNQYSLDEKLIKTWDYIKQAGEALNIPPQNISRCCRKGKGTAGGFVWKYINEKNIQQNEIL